MNQERRGVSAITERSAQTTRLVRPKESLEKGDSGPELAVEERRAELGCANNGE